MDTSGWIVIAGWMGVGGAIGGLMALIMSIKSYAQLRRLADHYNNETKAKCDALNAKCDAIEAYIKRIDHGIAESADDISKLVSEMAAKRSTDTIKEQLTQQAPKIK